MQPSLAGTFPAYTDFAPRVPVHCVTPGGTGYIHRYYDSSPFSPSGRYFAVTRLPFEDRLPKPGDVAEIAIVDLQTGELRTVAGTRGWDVQLGAQLQWGADDRTLLFTRDLPDAASPWGHQEDFYVSTRDENGAWTPARPVSGVVTPANEGAGTLSPDGRFIIDGQPVKPSHEEG